MTVPDSRKRIPPSLLIAFVLLAATLGLGAAARRLQAAAAPTTAPIGQRLAFEAPSSGPVRFSGHLDRGAIQPNGDGIVRMELALRADAVPGAAAVRLPTDLVVVLDRSGSMAGDKLVHARAAIQALIQALGPKDRFALVTYSDAAELRLPLATATPEARQAWLAAVEGIAPTGGTNIASGLDLGLAVVDGARNTGLAGGSPRVILISDGLANQGDVSRDGLRGRATRAARGEYALSTVGVGLDFDEELMASLADAGTGNFHYLENATNLSEIFANELATARETVAGGVTLRIHPAAGIELMDVAGYPITRAADGALEVKPGSLFAGQDRRLWATFRLPLQGAARQPLGAFALTYRTGDGVTELTFAETPHVARVTRDKDFFASLDRERWSESVVVDEYNRLQREVASDLKRGKAEEARAKVSAYGASIGALNQHVGSDKVAKKLDAAKDLRDRIDAFAAAPAPEQARAVKELQSSGVTGARPGSAK